MFLYKTHNVISAEGEVSEKSPSSKPEEWKL